MSTCSPSPVCSAPLSDTATPARSCRRPPLGHSRSTTMLGCITLTSTTRASSSPATSAQLERRSRVATFSARRSLGQELQDMDVPKTQMDCSEVLYSPREVFDMAVSDDAGVEQLNGKLPSANDSCRSAGLPVSPLKLGDMRPAQDSTETSADAWSMDDWSSPHHFSPRSPGCHTSPCSSASKLDEPQRVVADAILAELQVDLETAVQRATNEMSFCISEEIAFARQVLEEDIQKALRDAAEAQMSQQAELSAKCDQLQGSVEKQLLAMQKVQQTACQKIGEEQCTKDPRTSAHVMEARIVADERRWRMKLDGIETTLEKHLESIDVLGKQLSTFSCRFASHDVDIRENSQSIQRMEAQLKASQERERHEARAQFKTQLEMIESMRKQCADVEKRVTGCDFVNALQRMEAQMSTAEAERLALKKALEARSEGLDLLGKRTTELAEKVSGYEVEQRGLKMALEQRSDGLDLLGKQTSALAEKVAMHDTSMKGSAQAMQRLESRLSDAEVSRIDAQNLTGEQVQELNRAIQAQIFAAEQMQTQILTHEEGFVAALKLLEDEIKQEFGTLLESKIDSKKFSNAMATHDEATRRLMDASVAAEQGVQRNATELKSLTEELSRKSNWAQVDTMRFELKAWVETACQVHQKTVDDLFSAFEQARTTCEAQNDILAQHEQWMKDHRFANSN